MTETPLYVSVDLAGKTHLVGQLWARRVKGHESAIFSYDDSWLGNPVRFALEPALGLGRGPLHTLAGRALFGAIGDSAPDRWGRMLIQREERRLAKVEARTPHTLGEADYLIRVGDFARQGALRFSVTPEGPYLAENSAASIPPLVALPKLLAAAMKTGTDEERDADLMLLLAPGSSLGGARPKASVIDSSGALAIAKFPKAEDEIRIPVWEALALQMAENAGIPTPSWRLETIVRRPVLILQRFDRQGAQRIPFLSAMSMIGATDGEEHSYLEIVETLRRNGAAPREDCAQLWRRIVFHILISNTDDHLRNHGFLYADKNGWRLSPAYDLNPVPADLKEHVLALAIDEVDNTASLELAYGVAEQFGLKSAQAKDIVAEVSAAVRPWRQLAARLGLKPSEIDRMASAFVRS